MPFSLTKQANLEALEARDFLRQGAKGGSPFYSRWCLTFKVRSRLAHPRCQFRPS